MNQEETHRGILNFYREVLGQPQEWKVSYAGLEYPGEVIVSESWNPTLGQRLPLDTYFRVIFLTTPRRLRQGTIQDPRIVAAVPRISSPDTKQSLRQELKGIRETKALYETGRSPDILSIRYSIEEREQAIQRELIRLDARSYSQGRLYCQSRLDLTPTEIFAGGGPEDWADRLASALLSRTYPMPLFDHSLFPSTLTSDDIVALFRGLFQGDTQAVNLVSSFASGLGLTKRDRPFSFNPEGSQFMEILRQELEKRNGEMAVKEMVSFLRETCGLVAPLCTLYLLAFTRHMRSQIDLRTDYELISLIGKPLSTRVLTWDLIPEVSFTKNMAQGFQTIYLKTRADWSSVLAYASLIVEGLEPTNVSAQVEAQEDKLLGALFNIADRASMSMSRLESLARSLKQLPENHLEVLAKLHKTCSVTGYLEFYLAVQEAFESPSAFGQALQALESLEQLAGDASDIMRVHHYLLEATIGSGYDDLAIDKVSLISQIRFENFVYNTSLWLSLKAYFERFRSNYSEAYREHHALYHQESASLANRLERMRPQAKALDCFLSMPELGEQVGSGVPKQFEALTLSFKKCLLADEELILADVPVCQACFLRLDEKIPHQAVEQLAGELDRAMRHYNQILSSKAVQDLLAHPSKDQLEKFINLIQVSDLSTLGNVMDQGVIEFLRQYLRSS